MNFLLKGPLSVAMLVGRRVYRICWATFFLMNLLSITAAQGVKQPLGPSGCDIPPRSNMSFWEPVKCGPTLEFSD